MKGNAKRRGAFFKKAALGALALSLAACCISAFAFADVSKGPMACDHSGSVVKVEAREAGCVWSGNIEYWYCESCGEMFSDEGNTPLEDVNGDGSVNYDDVTIAPTGKHDLRWVEAKAPTCGDSGHVACWECESCAQLFKDGNGAEFGADEDPWVAPTSNHALTKVAAKAPTCTEPGNIEYYKCKNCPYDFKDANGIRFDEGESTVVNATGHSWGAPAWQWSADNTTATATFTCPADNATETVNASVTSKDDGGKTNYTAIATFNGKEYTATMLVDRPADNAPAPAITMYRLYNPSSGEHLFTADANERDTLCGIGWRDEGEGWIAPERSATPVYRLYNPYSGDHHYTLDRNEYDELATIGWSQEGVGWYSDDGQSVPLYRVFNPNVTVGTHHYTTDRNEYDTLPSYGWVQEGVAWYGM